MIRPLQTQDRPAWEVLWHGYQRFYQVAIAADVTEITWQRLLDPGEAVIGAMAFLDEQPVGLVHYLYHRSTWSTAPVCYLEDLFVSAEARGRGLGGDLLHYVYRAAAGAGADHVYWLTHQSNETARRLYARLGSETGFLHYRGVAPAAEAG